MDENAYYGHLELRLHNSQGLTWGDVAPLLDDLAPHGSSVLATRNNPQILLTGGGIFDVGFILLAVGSAAFVKRFCELLAEDIHAIPRLLATRLKEVRARKALPENDDFSAVIEVRFGSHSFVLLGGITEDEFRRRIGAARLLLETRSERELEQDGPAPPDAPLGWVWDEEEDRWVPQELPG